MSKSFTVVHEIPADVPTTFAAISGEGWPAKKAEVLHDGSRIVSRTAHEDGSVVMTCSRAIPDGVPGFLATFLPDDGRASQTDTWGTGNKDVRAGTWSANIPGAPVTMSGTMRLEPHAGGTRYTVEGTCKVSIPLVGGKAESFLTGLTAKLMDKEAEVLSEMVS